MADLGVFLRVVHGDDKGKGWQLERGHAYLIGRSSTCEIRLDDAAVSAQHAQVEFGNGAWTVTDLDSTHGTHVNGQRTLAAKPLFDQDRVQIGKTQLGFREYQQLSEEDLAEIDRGVRLPGDQ